jgi:tetratricopeptide (TPR) repeat protein
MSRTRRLVVTVCSSVCSLVAVWSHPALGQSVQYKSPAGIEYRSQPDTGPIARAQAALAADPKNVQRFIDLGVAQSGARQFREAIQTFTRGMAIAPNNAMLYRWRGHRHLSVREFDQAMADLTRGYKLDSTNYGILYHLGILRFIRGDFAGAADAFTRAQPRAPEAGELAGSTDWLWMSLMRAGRKADAQAMLARRPDSLTIDNAYARRLKLYRGRSALTRYSRRLILRTSRSRRSPTDSATGIWCAATRRKRAKTSNDRSSRAAGRALASSCRKSNCVERGNEEREELVAGWSCWVLANGANGAGSWRW